MSEDNNRPDIMKCVDGHGTEVFRVDFDGNVFWRSLMVNADETFQKAMLELKEVLTNKVQSAERAELMQLRQAVSNGTFIPHGNVKIPERLEEANAMIAVAQNWLAAQNV